MNRAMAALAQRKTLVSAIVVLLAAALPLALFAISSAAPPDGKGRPAGPPAAIELAPQPQRVACDGNDASTLRVRLTDDAGKPVGDGTTVFVDVRYGFADPVEAQTSKGEAFSNIRLYPIAASQPDGPTVTVYAGDLRASINLICDGGSDSGCNPFSPPQHPMSPPCLTPPPDSPPQCGFPVSPPCVTATPTPTCGEVLSPPCATPAPSGTPCTPSPLCESGPLPAGCGDFAFDGALYDQYVEANEQSGAVTARVGILDLGGGEYQAAQWHLCYDEQILDVTSISPAPVAPAECTPQSDDGERVLLSCFNFGGDFIQAAGDTWIVNFRCIAIGETRLDLGANTVISDTYVRRADADIYNNMRGTDVLCSEIGGPGATMTPRPPEPTPILTVIPFELCDSTSSAFTPTPTPPTGPQAVYGLHLNSTEVNGFISISTGIEDRGGGAYQWAQWYVCYDPQLVRVEHIAPANGAPNECAANAVNPSAFLLGCQANTDRLEYFGDTFVVSLVCLKAGTADFRLFSAPGITAVFKQGNYQPLSVQDATVLCTGAGATRTPTPSSIQPPRAR